MKTAQNPKRKAAREFDAKKLIEEIALQRVEATFRAAGLAPESAPRRRCDRLARQALKMIRGPIHTWRAELLDELIEAQTDLRCRLRAVELFAEPASREAAH